MLLQWQEPLQWEECLLVVTQLVVGGGLRVCIGLACGVAFLLA